jgi:(p)ppGpp synthase/HD superfamily hydrolase
VTGAVLSEDSTAGLVGERFERAVSYAAIVHGDHIRKGTDHDDAPGVPYLAHLLGVASIVLEQRGTEIEAIAAMLHDAVEDRGGIARLRDIRHRFGPDVAEIVEACSDTVVESGKKKSPWCERKRRYLDHLESLEDPLKRSVYRVTMADKLFNLRAIRRDAEQSTDRRAFWALFATGAAGQLWYYGHLAAIFAAHDPENPVTREIGRLVQELNAMEPEAARRAADAC